MIFKLLLTLIMWWPWAIIIWTSYNLQIEECETKMDYRYVRLLHGYFLIFSLIAIAGIWGIGVLALKHL
jgi:hypothetical protein